jgi:hypothetical protein
LKQKRDAKDELEGFVMEPHTNRPGSNNAALPRVTPMAKGKVIAVYPDDEAVEAMRSEGWITVKVGFEQNDAGDFSELALVKSEDGIRLKIRYYKQQRVKVSVSVRRHGTAVANAGTCTMKRIGDAFVFHILDCVGIAKD